MKRLLILLTLPLCAMTPRDFSPKGSLPKRVSFASDMNQCPLPGQVQLEDDLRYLHIGYDKARDTINKQTNLIKELTASVNYAHKRINFLQASIETLNKRVNRLPWYKRLNCFKKRH